MFKQVNQRLGTSWPNVELLPRANLNQGYTQWHREVGASSNSIGYLLNYSSSLGITLKGNHVKSYRFQGDSLDEEDRALVIAGVHGSELSGIEVANMLLDSLRVGKRPYYSVIVIPELFPDNAALARKKQFKPGEDRLDYRCTPSGKEDPMGKCKAPSIDPNRQFPKPGTWFDPSNPLDSQNRKIELENTLLLELIRSFKPSRIASIHAKRLPKPLTRKVDAPGIFADPYNDPQSCYLALTMAMCASNLGSRVPGNWLDSGSPSCRYSNVSHQNGVSLGEWGASMGITVITVEVQHYYATDVKGLTPVAPETPDGVKNRSRELKAHCTALREIFLGVPNVICRKSP